MLACGEVSHYPKECKNRKNNKLIKTLGSLDYFELSKEKTLDLALKKNKRIVEIVPEDEYEENYCEETSHMMKSSSISLGEF